MEDKIPKAIIFQIELTELSMIRQYRRVKEFLKPGNITFHFNEQHRLMSYDFTGRKRENDFVKEKSPINSVENPKI